METNFELHYYQPTLSLKDYSIEVYQPKFKSIWNALVSQSKNATFLFQREFMEYHQDRFDDFSLLVFRKTKLVAILPANKNGSELHSHQGLTYGGLIVPKTVRFDVVLESYYTLLKFLAQYGIDVLFIKNLPAIYHLLPSEELNYFNFIVKATLVRRDTLSVIDNRERLKFSSSRREGVRRGKKNRLRIEQTDDFTTFWNEILKVNLKNKHNAQPVHSLEDILYLKQKFPNHIHQFNVYHHDQLVAGATIFETDQVAHCQYISGNEDKNALGSLDVLHAYLINEIYAQKRYFDFGTSNENHGKQVNQGLQFWKEGFGARTVTQDFYKIDPNNYKQLETVFK